MDTIEGHVLVYGGAGAAVLLLCCIITAVLRSKRKAQLRREAVFIPHQFIDGIREPRVRDGVVQPLLPDFSQDAPPPPAILPMSTPDAAIVVFPQAPQTYPMGEAIKPGVATGYAPPATDVSSIGQDI